MPCLLVLLILAFPRIVLAVMYFTSTYLQRAYDNLLIPLLGFIFLPLTTLVYAWLANNHMPIEGVNLVYLIMAVMIDLGGLGGGESHRRRPRVIAYHSDDEQQSLVLVRPPRGSYARLPVPGLRHKGNCPSERRTEI